MTGATVAQVAEQEQVDPATVRRWLEKGCPCIWRGRKGPGNGARLDLEQVARWRGRASGPAGPTPEAILQRVAGALLVSLELDHAGVRAGISRDDAAAVLLVVWERCCETFGVSFKFDAQPAPICALMRII